jgi:hypothetical protein
MAFGIENTGGGSAIGGPTLTIANFVVTNANKIVVLIGLGGSQVPVTSITYGADNLVFVGAVNDTHTWCRVEIWEKHNPTVQTANIVINLPEQQVAAGVIGFIDAATSLGTFSSDFGIPANPTLTVVDSSSGDIVVSCIMTDLQTEVTDETSGTLIYGVDNLAADVNFNSQRQTATGTNSVCSWTGPLGSSPGQGMWAAIGVAVKSMTGLGTGYCLAGSFKLYSENYKLGKF